MTDASDAAFGMLVRIYELSFPASERKSVAMLRQMMKRDGYQFLVASAGDSILGFSISAVLDGVDAALLEYMAVAPEQRGKGTGQELFLRTASFGSIAGRHLLMEVDSDRTVDAGQFEARRKIFYRRLGCRVVEGLAYKMPPVSAQSPPPMEMMHYNSASPASIQKRTVRDWLEACYAQVYGVRMPDPRIDAMLDPLPSSIRLV